MKQTDDGGLRKLSRIGNGIDSWMSNGTNKGPRKFINPVGANGKTMLCTITYFCNSCGSYRHLLAECPDSWENMENKYVSQKELNFFLCVCV